MLLQYTFILAHLKYVTQVLIYAIPLSCSDLPTDVCMTEQIALWFKKYGEFVKLWAVIAQREGVDVIGLGAEMRALAQVHVGV